jgi:hypothetical protein
MDGWTKAAKKWFKVTQETCFAQKNNPALNKNTKRFKQYLLRLAAV